VFVIVPVVIAHSAAASWGGQCKGRQRVVQVLRALRRLAIVPGWLPTVLPPGWAKRCQQRQPVFALSRGVQRLATVPGEVSFRAAVSGYVKAWQRWQVLHHLRALQRHAMVLVGVICGAAFSACEDSSGICRQRFFREDCGARPLRRR